MTAGRERIEKHHWCVCECRQQVSVPTAKLAGGMSGMQDSLIRAKTDEFREANSAASRPAEGDHEETKSR